MKEKRKQEWYESKYSLLPTQYQTHGMFSLDTENPRMFQGGFTTYDKLMI